MNYLPNPLLDPGQHLPDRYLIIDPLLLMQHNHLAQEVFQVC
jgi:hypothetical protein